ncbi:MAG: hypothetical protein JJE37_09065 [Methyloceanibacter sp.]|nr:hypothetical protein [Methyloceanibacter sp.]
MASRLVGAGSAWLGAALDRLYIFWIHFIKPVYVIEPFELVRAAILVLVTGAIGYVTGLVFGLLWNRLHR